jgi:hypothetical protein
MKMSRPINKTLCVALVLLCVAVPLMAQQPSDGGYAQGKADGDRDGKGSAIWGLAGCLLGPVGILIAYFVPPSAPGSALMGKSSEYVLGYTEGYQSKGKMQNVYWAAGGCAASVVVYVIYYFVLIALLYGT